MILLICFIGGIVVGYLAALSLSTHTKAYRKLREALADKTAELDAYQTEVAKHFDKTADLFSELQDKQQALVAHLQDGTKSLRYGMLGESSYIAIQGKPSDAPKDYPLDKEA